MRAYGRQPYTMAGSGTSAGVNHNGRFGGIRRTDHT